MIDVIEIYDDCADLINVEENGQFSYSMFNRFSWLGQLRLIDWLSGDVKGVQPPEPYVTQKNRDWLSNFIVKYTQSVNDGVFVRPDDYYLYQDFYSFSGDVEDCDDTNDVEVITNPITLLGNDKFYLRNKSFIKGLKPSLSKPIGKQVGNTFEIQPSDIGSVVLEYIRLPKRAYLATMEDSVYNRLVPDPANSINFEWDEFARNILVFYICDSFANRNREQALKQTNLLTNKLDREGARP